MDDARFKDYMKCTEIQGKLKTLYEVKLQITSLFEIKGRKDYELQEKKEQITIMEI